MIDEPKPTARNKVIIPIADTDKATIPKCSGNSNLVRTILFINPKI
jgi:hypothetical protein